MATLSERTLNAVTRHDTLIILSIATLTLVALLRGAEYDEQYTLFLTGQAARPEWPWGIFTIDVIDQAREPSFDPLGLTRDLRRTDVHPPLYFWLVSAWRVALAPLDHGLFTARVLSVALTLGALALTARLARHFAVAPGLAVALTLGCYAFTYTGALARGFALAQILILAGALALIGGTRGRAILAGVCFGAAIATNYLAVFVAGGFVLGLWATRRLSITLIAAGAAPFLGLAAWCFLAQRGSRPDQFPPFEMFPALLRLLRYTVASMFGGLPLYVPQPADAAVILIVVGLAGALMILIMRWGTPSARWPLLGAAIAPAAGLLGLGVVFNNTPIELRYLSLGLPFAMIALAGVLASRPRLAVLTMTVQSLAIITLAVGRPTMQPAREAAMEAARLVPPSAVVLLPWGDDGVGIPGAFALHARAATRLALVHPFDTTEIIDDRLGDTAYVMIVTLPLDSHARAALLTLERLSEGWERIGTGRWASAYRRVRSPERSETDPYPPDQPRTSLAPRGPGPGDASGG